MKFTLKYSILILLISVICVSLHLAQDAAFERDISTHKADSSLVKDNQESVDKYKSYHLKYQIYRFISYVFSGILFVFVTVLLIKTTRANKALKKDSTDEPPTS